MADLVLGIAKPLVLGTLERAQLAIEEESKFRSSTQRDLVFITGEFQMMQSFLSATTEEKVKSEVVSTWVIQVRDLAYDVEDGIEFVIHLDTKPDWLFRFIRFVKRKPLPLDEAVDIIERLKARVHDVSQRCERYSRLIISDDSAVSSSGKENNQLSAEAGDAARRRRDMEALTKLITKEKSSEHLVFSVWARGGDLAVAGAASIFKRAYDNSKSWGQFELKAWVKLVRPFNLGEFINSLLDQFNACTSENQQGSAHGTDDAIKKKEVHMDQGELVLELEEKVKDKAYLVVLEDASTTTEWDTIQNYLPPNSFLNCLPPNTGSRILVSTRHLGVARHCIGSPCFQRFSLDQSQCVFFKEGPLIGRNQEVNQLCDHLAKARVSGLQVISIWGIAGAGKSALVRNLYCKKLNQLPTNNEYKKYLWVDVSHPFNLKDFCRSLLLQFRSDSLEAIEDPVRECQGLLKDDQCLLVVDNLQSTKDWDSIHEALAFRPSGSVIIVITNEERTASYCADRKDFVFNVKALEGGDAVDLYRRQVEWKIQSDQLPKELISKCGGLPEVIVAIADDLTHEFEWKKRANVINDEFINNLETSHKFACLRNQFVWIHSFFRSCPDILKPCIFYLSIFPQFQIIRRRRLVMRWIAEGYSKDKDSISAEHCGEELFTKITDLSMIQTEERTIITKTRMVRCQINAFFQEYILSRPNEENVTFALEVCALKGCCEQTTARTGRHIVIEKSWQRDKIVFESIDFSRLRSLTVFGKWESYFISESMKVLRVLDLENASGVTEEDLKKMLKLLPRLKFLSLRGCTDISNLPCSVGGLRQLQILDIRYTTIATIPTSITKLKKLQYLRAGMTIPPGHPSAPVFKFSKLCRVQKPVGVKVTSGVGKLTKLHTLGVINIGSAGGKDVLNEIKNLTQLRKLGVFGVNKKNSYKFCSAISGHSHLQTLSVWFKKGESLDGVTLTSELTEPPKKLQSLKLYRLANKLPVWISGLCNLRKINLEIEMSSNDDIEVIGGLPELCILRLRVKPPTDGMLNLLVMSSTPGVEARSYDKVKILEIACTSGSLKITFGNEAMQNLEVLKAGSQIKSVQFTGQNRLPKLKEVYVIGSHVDTLKKHLEEILVGHPCKPRIENEVVSTHTPTEGNDQRNSFPFYPTDSYSPMYAAEL